MIEGHENTVIAHAKRRVLIAEDELVNREMLSNILKNDFEILTAADGREALRIIEDNIAALSLVLLDLNMPVMSGQEVLRQLKSDQRYKNLPVIVLTADHDAEVESLMLGAVDFIPKPYPEVRVIFARVIRTIELFEDRELIRATERDTVTGLYNKEYFYKYCAELDRSAADKPMDAAVVDINHFHIINDRFGMSYGDEILRGISERLSEYAHAQGGIVCRKEGDMFLVYLPGGCDFRQMIENAAVELKKDESANSRVRLRAGVYKDADKSVSIEARFDRAKMASDIIRNNLTKNVEFYDNSLREKELYVEQGHVLALQHVLFCADDVVATLQHINRVLQAVLELFVEQLVACFLTLDATLGSNVVLLTTIGIEPVLLDSAGERVLLVLQVELRGELLQLCRLDIRHVATIVEDGHAEVEASTHVEVRLHLFAPAIVATSRVIASQTCTCTDGRVEATLCDVKLHVGCFDAQLGTLYLGSRLKCLCISFLSAWNESQHLFISWDVARHIERCVEVEFKESLELTLVVGKLCLCVDHRVLGAAELCLKLHDICPCHLSLIHHLHTSVILALSGGEQQLVDAFGFLRVHDLHIELGYLFLNGELALLCGKGRDAVLQFLFLDVLVVDATIPKHCFWYLSLGRLALQPLPE